MAFDGPSRYRATDPKKRANRQLSFEARVWMYCLIFCLPTIIMCIVLVWKASLTVQLTVIGTALLGLLLLSSMLLEEVVRPLQTLANVVAALREQDYSFRARGANRSDALGELSTEINGLADMLQSQRLGELEATALLRRVIDSMDAPVLAFDQGRRLRLLNPAAERVLLLNAERDTGRRAEQLHLEHLIDAPDEGLITLDAQAETAEMPARKHGRWMVRRSGFRQRGVPHSWWCSRTSVRRCVMRRTVAWRGSFACSATKSIIRLAPIKSIAGSLLARCMSQSFRQRVRRFRSRLGGLRVGLKP